MSGISIRVFGFGRAKLVPQEMQFALDRFREELLPPLVADFRDQEPSGSAWPKSPRRRRLRDQTVGAIKGPALIVGQKGSRYGRHLDEGGEVQARKREFMRFKNKQGEFVFVRKGVKVKHAPRPYFGRVLTRVTPIVEVIYNRVFGAIGR